MICAYCGQEKKYPEEFPSSIYAQCKKCFEKHQKLESRKFVNKIFRFFKKEATDEKG